MEMFYVLTIIVIGEILIHLIFIVLSRMLGKEKRDKITGLSIFKGLLERAFVVVTLNFEMVSALTLLGALKIATRIKDTEDKISNDFFLIGNLTSVLFAIGYFVIGRKMIGQ
ncbi:MAG TPA: hypothetical protein VL728_10505 [Cyclobacteriaceae bacterium]|jgi:hypothetical protein|nr:hypothetical protein [Cyclobacteriaceae bacterium]